AIVIAFGPKRVASIAQGGNVLGVEFDCLVIILNCAIVFALFAICTASFFKGEMKFLIELDRLAKIFNGSVIVALAFVGDTAFVKSNRVLTIEPDCLILVGDGAVVVALTPQSDAALMVGIGPIFCGLAFVLNDRCATSNDAIGILGIAILAILLARPESRRSKQNGTESDYGKKAHHHLK